MQSAELIMSIEKIPEFTAGSKMFLNPRIYKLWNHDLPRVENRTQDYFFHHPFLKSDTTIYQLPVGYTVETLPKSRNLRFQYGSFTTAYVFDEKQRTITATAMLFLNQNRIPVSKFAETKKFFSDVLEEYSEKIVVKKL